MIICREDQFLSMRKFLLVHLQDGILNVNQSFTFDVREMKSAQIALQVVARGVLGMEEALGHINNLCVLNLLEVEIWVLLQNCLYITLTVTFE